MSRPFPAFTGINQNQQNERQDDVRLAAVRGQQALGEGRHLNANYTWVPRWTEDGANTTTGIGNAYVDEVSLLQNHGPYFSQRKHRITASGVWELPWYRNQKQRPGLRSSAAGRSRRCSSIQSGQPWDMPGNVDLAPGVDLKDIALSRQTRKGSSSTASSRASASGNADDRQVRSAVRTRRRTAARSRTS